MKLGACVNFKTFWLTGYDTTGQTLAYAGYELAKNPEIQKRLQEEVDQAYDENDGQALDYAVIQVNKVSKPLISVLNL